MKDIDYHSISLHHITMRVIVKSWVLNKSVSFLRICDIPHNSTKLFVCKALLLLEPLKMNDIKYHFISITSYVFVINCLLNSRSHAKAIL